MSPHQIWFTADTHFGHGRIIEYTRRPFQDPQEMEEAILEQFNARIKPGDSLYHLGDLAWSTWLPERGAGFFKQLNSKQLHLIRGNHDRLKDQEYRKWFCWVGDYKTLSAQDRYLVMSHYPFRSWLGREHGSYQLHGHCHGKLPPEGRQMDVGVDPQGFEPVSLDRVIERLDRIEMREA